MSGTVVRVLVSVGDSVSVDQDVVVIESMKMEMTVPSTAAGRVKSLHVAPEEFVQEGQLLLTLE
jgi:acetyl-CoA carboxylase biotin carboxyl carrier protein